MSTNPDRFLIQPAKEDDWPWIMQGQVEIAWARLGPDRQREVNRQAIREGVEAIALKAPAPTLERVKDIAEQSEVAILDIAWAGALDLGASNDPQADSENHLAKGIGAVANPRALG